MSQHSSISEASLSTVISLSGQVTSSNHIAVSLEDSTEEDTHVSEDFAEIQCTHSISPVSYSDDFVTEPSSKQPQTTSAVSESVDLYSEDFDSDSNVSRLANEIYIIDSSHSWKTQYSDDFDPASSIPDDILTKSGNDSSGTPRYSDDFETESVGTVARGNLDVTVGPTTPFYSDDFETSAFDSELSTTLSTRPSAHYMTYTDTFESDTSQVTEVSSPRQGYDDTSDSAYTASPSNSAASIIHKDVTWTDEASKARAAFVSHALRQVNESRRQDAGQTREKGPLSTPRASGRRTESEKLRARKVKSFCHHALKNLKAKSENAKSEEHQRPQDITRDRYKGADPKAPVETFGIPNSTIVRLQVENTKAKFDRMAREEIHEPNKCHSCRKKLATVAEREFLKAKTQIAAENLVAQKLEKENIRCNDQVGLFGEILIDLPALTLDAREVTARLLRPLREGHMNASTGPLNAKDENFKQLQCSLSGINTEFTGRIPSGEPQDSDRNTKVSRVPDACALHPYDSMAQDDFWKLYFSRLKSTADPVPP